MLRTEKRSETERYPRCKTPLKARREWHPSLSSGVFLRTALPAFSSRTRAHARDQRQQRSTMCNTLTTLGIYPREPAVLHIVDQECTRDDHCSGHKPGVRKETTLRNVAHPTVIALGLPFVYPIVVSFSLYTRKDLSAKNIPTVTPLRTLRC